MRYHGRRVRVPLPRKHNIRCPVTDGGRKPCRASTHTACSSALGSIDQLGALGQPWLLEAVDWLQTVRSKTSAHGSNAALSVWSLLSILYI